MRSQLLDMWPGVLLPYVSQIGVLSFLGWGCSRMPPDLGCPAGVQRGCDQSPEEWRRPPGLPDTGRNDCASQSRSVPKPHCPDSKSSWRCLDLFPPAPKACLTICPKCSFSSLARLMSCRAGLAQSSSLSLTGLPDGMSYSAG